MESKLIKVKTDGDILRDANVISGIEIDGSEYVVYYIDRDDGENDNIFASKLINNNDGTYNMLNIENANEKINVTNTVKELVMKAIEDSEHDTLEDTMVNLRSKTVKLCPVVINKEQTIDIQKTYITTVKKSVTVVAKKYYDVPAKVVSPVVEPVTPVVEVPAAVQPEVGIVSSVTGPQEAAPVVEQTVPTVVEPVLPVLETPQPVVQAVPVAPVQPVVETPVVAQPVSSVASTPVIEQKTTTPVLDIPAGIITEPAAPVSVQPTVQTVAPTPVLIQPEVVVPAEPVVEPVLTVETPAVTPVPVAPAAPTTVETQPVAAAPVVNPVVTPEVVQPVVAPVTPSVVQPEPEKLVLDASKESNLNSALGEISKETIAVADINAIKEFGEEDTPVATNTQTVAPMVQSNVESAPKVLTKKAGFANSKFFMFIAVGFFIASCIFMGYEAFNYYQIVK